MSTYCITSGEQARKTIDKGIGFYTYFIAVLLCILRSHGETHYGISKKIKQQGLPISPKSLDQYAQKHNLADSFQPTPALLSNRQSAGVGCKEPLSVPAAKAGTANIASSRSVGADFVSNNKVITERKNAKAN